MSILIASRFSNHSASRSMSATLHLRHYFFLAAREAYQVRTYCICSIWAVCVADGEWFCHQDSVFKSCGLVMTSRGRAGLEFFRISRTSVIAFDCTWHVLWLRSWWNLRANEVRWAIVGFGKILYVGLRLRHCGVLPVGRRCVNLFVIYFRGILFCKPAYITRQNISHRLSRHFCFVSIYDWAHPSETGLWLSQKFSTFIA